MEHTLRIVELQRPLHDALLERGLEDLFGRHSHLKVFRSTAFRGERVTAVESE